MNGWFTERRVLTWASFLLWVDIWKLHRLKGKRKVWYLIKYRAHNYKHYGKITHPWQPTPRIPWRAFLHLWTISPKAMWPLHANSQIQKTSLIVTIPRLSESLNAAFPLGRSGNAGVHQWLWVSAGCRNLLNESYRVLNVNRMEGGRAGKGTISISRGAPGAVKAWRGRRGGEGKAKCWGGRPAAEGVLRCKKGTVLRLKAVDLC